MLGNETIDLRYVEQLADTEQINCLSYMMLYAEEHLMDGRHTIREIVEKLYDMLETGGMAALCAGRTVPGNLALPRKEEFFSCINRYRGLRL